MENVGLLGKGDARYVGPRILLLDRVLDSVPQEGRIEFIAQILLREGVGGAFKKEEAIALVEALEKLFGEDKMAFRVKLMKLCNAIPMQVEGDHHYNEQLEVAADLRLAMLVKVIEGWAPLRRFGEPWGLQEDAEACFRFLCDSYEKAPLHQWWGNYPNWLIKKEPGRIRKGILDLIRKRLETHLLPLDELDIRVAQPAPDPIKLVLCHARIRQADMSLLQEEAAKRSEKP